MRGAMTESRGLRGAFGRVRENYPRTALALALTAVAVALPSSALYVAGTHATQRDADQRQRLVQQRAEQAASLLAQKLTQRLEALRENEDRRPFYHYQNLYHDPMGAHQGPSIVPSPLADGPADPLIRSHFQIAPDGVVTLPTVNLDVPEMSCQRQRERHMAMLRSLQPAAPICCGDEDDPVAVKKAAIQQAAQQEDFSSKTIVLDEEDWLQNLEASQIYAELKGGRAAVPVISRVRPSGRKVRIQVEGFHWKTVPLEGGPSLVALRRVLTPAGLYTQGFVICNESMKKWLQGSPMPARFVEQDAEGEGIASPLHLVGANWAIELSPEAEMKQAGMEGRAARGRFQKLFLFLIAGAGLAGALAIGVVWQAERLARQRSRFAASAAHELRTPLAGLRMYGEMLAEGLGDPNRSREYARRVAEEAERLGRVVSNVLGFSRLEQGLLKVNPEVGDLVPACREHIERLRPTLEQAGADVRLIAPESLPKVRFDADALGQILQNLLDNAEKYSRGAEDRTIEVRLSPRPKGVVLEVADHGPGIPPELRGRLFHAFSRGANNDVPEGLGLGLMLTQSLARLQGGRISYANGERGGAVLSVVFPV